MRTLEELVSAKAESALLNEGWHIVHLISKMDCTSFQDVEVIDGKLAVIGFKSNLPKWNTPTEQVAVLVGNEAGVCCDRFSWDSWKKPKDITKEDGDENEFSVSGEYAVHVVNGKVERVPNPAGIATCLKNMKNFLSTLNQGIDGVDGKEIVPNAIANKIPFQVKIKKVTWTNPVTLKTSVQFRIEEFKPIKKDGVVTETKKADLVIPEDMAS